jgi:hypothetical protein
MPSDTYTLTISDAGVSTPSTGSVTNASVASNAAIAFSKLATLTSGNILVGNSSNVAASVALSGNVTVSNAGVATIANDAVTFAKMQNVSGYSILAKPSSGSGDVAEVASSSYMLEASTGFLRQADATSARSTLGLTDAATGNALLSSGVGAAPVYGKVGLTTHVSGTLPAANGGTGLTSYAVGDIAYASGATTLAKLADVATGNALLSGGVGAAPFYGKVALTTHVSGTLPVANGGSGLASYTIGDITYASGSTTLAALSDVATGNALLSGGVGAAPVYGKIGLTTHVSGTLPVANGGSGLASYTIGDITYASGSTTLAALSDVATGNALLSGGVGAAPVYGKVGLTTHVSGTLPAANGGTGLNAYSIGDIPCATDTATLTIISDVDTGNVLLSGGVEELPFYGKVGLATHVSGTLPAANGGTGQSSYAIGDIPYASGSTTLSKLADVATGSALLSGGIGAAPAYGKVGLTTHISGILAVTNGGTGVTASTGSGNNVLSNSPTLVTPEIGAATGTSLAVTGAITSSGTSGIGYTTGAGGTVTQLTSKSTTVTLNKTCGRITMHDAALAHDTAVSFTLVNTTIAANDVLILNHLSGGTIGSYTLNAQCAAGSASITVRNARVTNVTLSEAIVIAFVVIKAAIS